MKSTTLAQKVHLRAAADSRRRIFWLRLGARLRTGWRLALIAEEKFLEDVEAKLPQLGLGAIKGRRPKPEPPPALQPPIGCECEIPDIALGDETRRCLACGLHVERPR